MAETRKIGRTNEGDIQVSDNVSRAEPSRGAPDAESKKEQLDRLHSMASGDETWDLSPNDLTALRNLLDGHVVLLEALRLAKREMVGLAAYMETCEPSVIVDNLPSLAKALNLKVDAIEAVIQKAEGI